MPVNFNPHETKIGRCFALSCDFSGQVRLFYCHLPANDAAVGAVSTVAPRIGPLCLVSHFVVVHHAIFT